MTKERRKGETLKLEETPRMRTNISLTTTMMTRNTVPLPGMKKKKNPLRRSPENIKKRKRKEGGDFDSGRRLLAGEDGKNGAAYTKGFFER